MMSGDWANAWTANQWALDNAQRLVAADHTVAEWRTDCLLPARWMQIAIRNVEDAQASTRDLIDSFKREFIWDAQSKSADERFAWIMVEVLDGMERRMSGDEVAARASLRRAALSLPENGGLLDARLLGAARYLQRSAKVSGLPVTAPALAGRVRYNVGALLPANRG